MPFFSDLLPTVLTHLSANETTGCLFEVSGGWAAQTRWQRAGGYGFPVNKPLTPEAIISKWDVFTSFGACLHFLRDLAPHYMCTDDGRATHPTTAQESITQVSTYH